MRKTGFWNKTTWDVFDWGLAGIAGFLKYQQYFNHFFWSKKTHETIVEHVNKKVSEQRKKHLV